MANKPKVSAAEARRIAQQTVGKYPPSRPPRGIVRRGTGLSESEKKRVQQKRPVEVTRTKPQTKEQIASKIAAERNARLKKVFPKVTARGTGTTIAGPKRGPSVQVAKASPATTRAKLVTPADRKLDASRKAAMKAAEEARSKKTPAQRELEQRPERQEKRPVRRSSSAPNPQQSIADRRVAEALKEIKEREAARARAARLRGRGGSGIRGPIGNIGGGGGMNWDTK